MIDLCRACGAALTDDEAFCGVCGTQVRCHRCNGLLKTNKEFCTKCGAAAGEGSVLGTSGNTRVLRTTDRNIIEYREDKTGRYLRAEFTDTTASNMAGPLSAALAGRPLGPILRPRAPIQREQEIIEEGSVALSSSVPSDAHSGKLIPSAVDVPPADGKLSENDQLHMVFRYDDDRLQLIESRLKARSQLDYARRLSYLFLYAHSVAGRNQVRKSELNSALDDAGVLDSNTRHWVNSSPELLPEDQMIGLRVSGREKARQSLADVFNPELPDPWLPGSTSKTRNSKATSAQEGDMPPKRRAERNRSSPVEAWVTAWKRMNLSIDHAILEKCSLMDKGIIGLWAIRTVDEASGKVVPCGLLAKFLYEAFEIQVYPRSMERALKSAGAKGKVLPVKGTQCQITPSGMVYARQAAGLPPDYSLAISNEPAQV